MYWYIFEQVQYRRGDIVCSNGTTTPRCGYESADCSKSCTRVWVRENLSAAWKNRWYVGQHPGTQIPDMLLILKLGIST